MAIDRVVATGNVTAVRWRCQGASAVPAAAFIAAAAARAVNSEQLDREGVGLLEGAPDRVVAV
jgi:hypothetical protein